MVAELSYWILSYGHVWLAWAVGQGEMLSPLSQALSCVSALS